MTAYTGMAAFEKELTSRLGSFIKRAEQALMTEKARVLRPHELTVAQYSALMLLLYVPEASAAQLSRACAVTPQTMATILTNLEAKGLITRHPSTLHQRVLSTRLTPAGSDAVRNADRAAKAVERDLTAVFTAEEGEQIRHLLDRVCTTLHDRPATTGKSEHRPTDRSSTIS
jgi:DNA-binding MarR family transcriptional regulator